MVMQTNPSHAATEDTAAARYEVIRQFLRHILVAQRVPKHNYSVPAGCRCVGRSACYMKKG